MKTLILAIVFLAGCNAMPKGVEISDDERKACAAEGCTVWTPGELQNMARHFFMEGVKRARGSL